MKANLHLKRGLITQSLSPVFVLLIIRHSHCDYLYLIGRCLSCVAASPVETIMKVLLHPRFGELLVVIGGLILAGVSFISIPAFRAIQDAGFESRGERIIVIEEQKDAGASFLMTFVLPLLIDELSSPQYWFSYIIVIVFVFIILNKSNLYYQSSVLSLLNYKVFKFQVLNPTDDFKENKAYIGITRKNMITEDAAIMWKYIADDVFLVYNEGKRRG